MRVLFEIQGDSSTVMAFAVREATVREIREKFPLAGDWHFRVKESGGCWRDLVDQDETLTSPVHLRALPLVLPSAAPAVFQAEDWIVEEGLSWEHEAAFRAVAPVAATTAAAAPTAATLIDEKLSKLGSSMFSAFKSVVKNVS
ncbi:hypothetical protein BASA81_008905 [Batrachochytrium salamandrivorans]|nr:hypothetical protein BASA81_008905 [Batrachochytrium salamandrivorans]